MKSRPVVFEFLRAAPRPLGVVAFTLALASMAQASVTNLAYWRFGENDPFAAHGVTSTATTNLVGGVMNLMSNTVYTTNVSTVAAGRVGSTLGLQFTSGLYGTNALVSTLTNNFGLELWVKPDATNTTQFLAFNGRSSTDGWGLVLFNNGQYRGLIGSLGFFGGATATPGVWAHVALVRDNATVVLYVNGVPFGTSANQPKAPTSRFAVAVRLEDMGFPFAGVLDEVRVFTFAPGTFSTNDLLWINGQRPRVTTIAASGIGITNATLNGTVNPGNLATAMWFEWGATTNYGSFTATNTLAATNSALAVSNNLTGLILGNTYHYRLVATNVLGLSYGTDQSFMPTTFTNVPLPGVPGVNSSSVRWGDYDNDGRLDFLLSGYDGPNNVLQLWRNTGSGFTNMPLSGVSGVFGSSVAWGDYDNDGRLDFLVTGTTNGSASGAISQLWRNTGSGFANVPLPGVPGVLLGSVAWGDYDNDGHLDFLLTGDSGGFGVSQLWRNTGNGFTNVPLPGVPGVRVSFVAWADYDNDGWLDFLLTGDSGGGRSQLWRNTGSGFTNVPLPGVPGVSQSSVAWGDYDNDGWLDFLLTGYALGSVSQLWRNTGGAFTNVPLPGVPGVGGSSVGWGDYDNDGRLDFLLTGNGGGGPVAQLWRNLGSGFTNVTVTAFPMSPPILNARSVAWGDYDNDGRLDLLITGGFGSRLLRNITPVINTLPVSPNGLTMTATTNAVMFSWNAATDMETMSSGLTYNVRAGTTPGGNDLLAAHANPTNGLRRIPALGGACLRHCLPLTGVTNGQTVYWSVQAVDTAFAGGPFATETSVVNLPQLAITPSSSTNAVVSWMPPTFGWVLQERTNLAVGDWINSPSGELNPATVFATNAARFYRLKSQ